MIKKCLKTRYTIPALIFIGIPFALHKYCNTNDNFSEAVIEHRKTNKSQKIDVTEIAKKQIKEGTKREDVYRYIRKNCYSFSTNPYKNPNPLIFHFTIRDWKTYGIFYDTVIVTVNFENELVSEVKANASFESI